MIHKIPLNREWKEHFISRLNAAKELGLITDESFFPINNASLFTSDYLSLNKLDAMSPAISMVESQAMQKTKGWVKVPDLFDDVANWLDEQYKGSDKFALYAEAGYTEIGDKVLDRREHVVINQRPVLALNFSDSSVDKISQLLRWSRSRRILGAIKNITQNSEELFFCDVFDMDSLIICPKN